MGVKPLGCSLSTAIVMEITLRVTSFAEKQICASARVFIYLFFYFLARFKVKENLTRSEEELEASQARSRKAMLRISPVSV